jgi:hypothetical protein
MPMVDEVACKDCGWQMHYVENKRKNEFYSIKVDTWLCCNCNRIVEEPRVNKKFGVK